MKKLIFMLVVLSMTVVTGCKKDDKTSNPETLNNTTWGYSETSSDETGSTSIVATLKFEKTSFTMTTTFTPEDGEENTQVEKGSYVYTDPNVTLTLNDSLEEPISGIVDGDTITIKDEDKTAVFTKQ